jgi:hypothetical protein
MASGRMIAICMAMAAGGIHSASWGDLVVSSLSSTTLGGIQRFSNSGTLEATLGTSTGISKLSLAVGQNGNLYAGGMGTQSGQYYEFNSLNNASIPLASAPSTIPQAGVFTVGWNGDIFTPGQNVAVTGAAAGIVQLDGTTGAYLGTPISYAGSSPYKFRDVAFSPDHQLYAADLTTITRYDLIAGVITQDTSFSIPVLLGSTPTATGVIRFNPESSNLYVSNRSSIQVYSATDGSLLNTFIAAGTGGLGTIDDFTFGDDGYAYVVSTNSQNMASVLRFDANTGAYAGTVINPVSVVGIPQIAYLPAPEPSSVGMMGLGAMALLRHRRRSPSNMA